jgi:hypothetical protein
MKLFLYNPENGSSIKKWYDGSSFWKLEVGEMAAFPVAVGERLKETYGFLQVVSPEDFDSYLAKLDKKEVSKVVVDSQGQAQAKPVEVVEKEEKALLEEKKLAKEMKEKVKKVKDAEPDDLEYWEMSRGSLLNEIDKRGLEVKTAKGVYVSKEQLISLLENNDNEK